MQYLRLGAMAAARQAVAAVEFALVAPLMLLMVTAVFDAAHAVIAWQQVNNAAQAIAEAAEKLSVSSGSAATSLTSAQMQNAMTSIYAEMPGLALGGGNGLFPGAYSVTLSEVVFCPTRTQASYFNLGCSVSTGAQSAFTLWSTYLQYPTTGGPMIRGLTRPCGLVLTPEYPTWGTSPLPTRLQQMVDPSNGGAAGLVLTPQVVADVQYQFTPAFSKILPISTSLTFWASAVLPTPFGDNTQAITYTTVANDTLIVSSCTAL